MPVWIPSCTTNIPQAAWNHLVATYSGGGTIYVNGSSALSAGHTDSGYQPLNSIGASSVAINSGNDGEFIGFLDEVRLSSVARSVDWIATEYANQNAPGTWINTGSQNPLSTSGDTLFFGSI